MPGSLSARFDNLNAITSKVGLASQAIACRHFT
jgi:hypothetical protein